MEVGQQDVRKSGHRWKVIVTKIFKLVVIDKFSKLRHAEEDEWVDGKICHIKVNHRERKLEEIPNGRQVVI